MNGIENVKQIFVAFTLFAVIEHYDQYGEGHHPLKAIIGRPDRQAHYDEFDGLRESILSGVIQHDTEKDIKPPAFYEGRQRQYGHKDNGV